MSNYNINYELTNKRYDTPSKANVLQNLVPFPSFPLINISNKTRNKIKISEFAVVVDYAY